MNSSFSTRLSPPSLASTSLSTSKCSGSLSMSTPSMSNTTAAKRVTNADDTVWNVIDGLVTSGGVLVRADQPWADAQLAQLYDAFPFDGDVPLYLDLARSEGGRVLEVACGSGRVTLPLVQAGCRVVGVDISPHMLAIARAK